MSSQSSFALSRKSRHHLTGPRICEMLRRSLTPYHDPRWTAASSRFGTSPCSHCCRGSGPSDPGILENTECPSLPRLSALGRSRLRMQRLRKSLSRVLKRDVQYKQVSMTRCCNDGIGRYRNHRTDNAPPHCWRIRIYIGASPLPSPLSMETTLPSASA